MSKRASPDPGGARRETVYSTLRGGAATGAVMVTADGTSVRVPVTVVREAAAAELSLPAIEPTGRLGLAQAAQKPGPLPAVARLHLTERRARRASDRLPDRDPLQYRLTLETDDTPAGDRAALTALHNATTGDNWWRNTHWLSERPLGEWYGVTTDTDDRVTALELSDNRLTGAVPDVLGSLTRLELLDLSRNALTGSIPGGVGRAGRPEAAAFRLQPADGRQDPLRTRKPVQPRVPESPVERVRDADPSRVGELDQSRVAGPRVRAGDGTDPTGAGQLNQPHSAGSRGQLLADRNDPSGAGELDQSRVAGTRWQQAGGSDSSGTGEVDQPDNAGSP